MGGDWGKGYLLGARIYVGSGNSQMGRLGNTMKERR